MQLETNTTGAAREAGRPEGVTDEHLEYLDDLRESGETNMFGAGAYLESYFGMDRKEAKTTLLYWMKTFGQETR